MGSQGHTKAGDVGGRSEAMGFWATTAQDDLNGPSTAVKVRSRLKRYYMGESGGVCDVGEWDGRGRAVGLGGM